MSIFFGSPRTLSLGEKKTIVCQNVYSGVDQDFVSWSIEITWTDLAAGATYVQDSDDLILEGPTSFTYIDRITANSYWNSSSADGCFDAAQDPIPVCTCVDLNKTRDVSDANISLQNSIDFVRCNVEFGADFISGSGWTPLPTSSGSLFGNNQFIGNLRSTQNGLGDYNYIEKLGMHSGYIDITTNGGLLGTTPNIVTDTIVEGEVHAYRSGSHNAGLLGYNVGEIYRTKGFGFVNASGDAGGLIYGDLVGDHSIEFSSFSGRIESSGSTGGLLWGTSGFGSYVRNSFADAIHSSGSASGIVVYYDGTPSTKNLFYVNSSDFSGDCVLSLDCSAVETVYQIPRILRG